MKSVILFLLLGLNVYSQENVKQLNLGIRYNRLDFFIEPSIVFSKLKVKHELGFGLGINRTFAQKRFFPEVNYSLMSKFKGFHNCEIQGITSYHLSLYNPNKLNKEQHFFNEMLIGFNFLYGKKYKTFIQPEIGMLSESFQSDLLQKTLHFTTFSYSLKFGFSYVL